MDKITISATQVGTWDTAEKFGCRISGHLCWDMEALDFSHAVMCDG
jgi:hypothetical protein